MPVSDSPTDILNELRDRHLARARTLGGVRINDPDEGESALHDALLAVHKNIQASEIASDDHEHLAAWSWSATLLNAANTYRSNLRFSDAVATYARYSGKSAVSAPEDPERDLERKEVATIIGEIMRQMPHDLRLVVDLKLLQGLSLTKTANSMGYTVPRVRTLLKRANRFLRPTLSRLFRNGEY